MAKIKVWDKNKRKVSGEREISPGDVSKIERYKIRDHTGNAQDGCAITLKDEKGGDGEKIRSNENYNEVCRKLHVTAKGASDTPEGKSDFPTGQVPSSV